MLTERVSYLNLPDNGVFMGGGMKLFRLFLLTGFFLFVTGQIPPATTQSHYPRYINRAENKCFYGEEIQDRRWNNDWLEMCSLPSTWEDNSGIFKDCPTGYTHLKDAAQMQSLCSPWVKDHQIKPPLYLNDDTKQCFHDYLPTLPSSSSADKSCVLPRGWSQLEFGVRHRFGHKNEIDDNRTECPDDYKSINEEAIKKLCSWVELRPVPLRDEKGFSGQEEAPSDDDSYSSPKGFGCFGG